MGKTMIDAVIQTLQSGGIPALHAYPGNKMPALNEACAAVRYKQVDMDQEATQVWVTVMTPAALGGTICEETARYASKLVQDMGGRCQQGECVFDSIGNLFSVEICAAFDGMEIPDNWMELPGTMVTLGGQRLDYVKSFSVWRDVDETVRALSDAVWHFRLEELFLTKAAQYSEPDEPFSIVVQRMGKKETYADCTWTHIRQENTGAALRRVREGIVGDRSVMA